MTAWTLVFHILGLVFWIGALLIVTNLMAQHVEEPSRDGQQVLGRVELRLLKSMANPGAVLTVITGVILILTNPAYYLHAGWLHAKLVLVAILLWLHWVTSSRTRGLVEGRVGLTRKDCMALHGAIALVFLGILIFVLPGEVFWR